MSGGGVFDLELNEPGNDVGGNGERHGNNGEESSDDEHVQVSGLCSSISLIIAQLLV